MIKSWFCSFAVLLVSAFFVPQAHSELVLPDTQSSIQWDSEKMVITPVQVNHRGEGRYRFRLKGRILAKEMKSFAYQVNGKPAQSIRVLKREFDTFAEIDALPSMVRFWVEVSEGKKVRLDSFEIAVEKESRGIDKKVLINY